MQGFYVKSVQNNWLNLIDDDEIEYGWIHAKNLLLSIHSLKSEGNIEKGNSFNSKKSYNLIFN